jgi:hypothetical protein
MVLKEGKMKNIKNIWSRLPGENKKEIIKRIAEIISLFFTE